MVQGLYSEDPQAQMEATTQFRKLLSIERSPPIEEVIAQGVINAAKQLNLSLPVIVRLQVFLSRRLR